MEAVTDFLKIHLPDILAFVLIAVGYVLQFIVRYGLRKDTDITKKVIKETTKNVEAKTQRVDDAFEQLQLLLQKSSDENALMQAEMNAIRGEMETLRQAMKLGFGNVESLVKSGVASKIAKELEKEKIEEEETNDTTR